MIAAPMCALWICAQAGVAQDPGSAQGASATPLAPLGVATVHGVVRNAASGEPLPRALVLVGGESGQATLTDGDGRFEIPGVAMGTDTFQLTKPGFEDAFANGFPEDLAVGALGGITHNVVVTEETPELDFQMQPLNVIRGQIQLSTGDPAENIGVMLLARSILDGRAMWRPRLTKQTDSDGRYRFAGLPDGVYAIETLPSMDSELANALVAGGTGARAAQKGFANMFYPDAREFSSAARIKLKGGEQATANMTLTEEPFHLVRAAVRGIGDRAGTLSLLSRSGQVSGMTFSAGGPLDNDVTVEVCDARGDRLEYQAKYEGETRSAQATLPNGDYVLRLTSVRFGPGAREGAARAQTALGGQAGFTLTDHPVTNLQIAVAPIVTSPVEVTVTHGAQAGGSATENGEVFVAVSRAGSANSDGMTSQLAEGQAPGTLETNWEEPGAYWVHTIVAQAGLCESSFTAGGASLAREPLVVNQSGTTAPLTLVLRDDCGRLKLRLPPAAAALTAGEERAYTVFVVPDFDSTTEAHLYTLRPSSGDTVEAGNLTPGNYHIYVFAAPVELEYRNPEVLGGLTGQAVTVSPGTTQEIVVEAPAK